MRLTSPSDIDNSDRDKGRGDSRGDSRGDKGRGDKGRGDKGRGDKGRGDKGRDLVVLVHGLAAHRVWMSPLERRLVRSGYRTLNWGYNSLWGGIEVHAERLRPALRQLDEAADVDHVRLVTHSMGGIVARKALEQAAFRKLRTLVMLGPPNRGSRVANVLSRALGWLVKPLHQLSDDRSSFVNQLAIPESLDIGVIAASYDRVVAVQSTHLPTQRDHCIVPSGHNSMLWRRDVAGLVIRFLQSGRFADESSSQARDRESLGWTG